VFHAGDVVRTLRRAHGWTQKQLAAKAGVSDMTISKIERSARFNYRRTTMDGLARALDTTTAALITPPPSSEAREDGESGEILTNRLLALWAALKPEHRPAGIDALAMVVALASEFESLSAKALLTQQQDDAQRPATRGASARRSTTVAAPDSRHPSGSRRSVGRSRTR
jgi:transcriptional regulator with XRE-family HTH domain